MDANAKWGTDLKKKLLSGQVCFGATVSMSNTVVSEMLSHMDFDWIWLEQEHTAMSNESTLAMLQSTNGADTGTVVRVPWNDKTMLKRVLDMGPDGVIIPLVRTAEDAKEAVKAIKYPPLGERGGGLSRAQAYGLTMGDYMGRANDDILTILMIEHIDAVKNIDEILAVPGVDSIMVGALDLSGSMNKLGQTSDPEVEEAIQKVLKACKKAKKPAGIITLDPEGIKKRVAEGFTNIIIGIDVLLLSTAANNMLESVKDLKE
ncbi:MAG: HpcH/HpaI aldolase family protein [Fusobacteriota bacterium]